MVRRTRPQMCNCTSGNLEHPGSFHSRLAMTTTSSLQRLVDLGLEPGVEIRRCDRTDQLVDDRAFAADNEGLGHAIDAPFDRGAAGVVDADNVERIAGPAHHGP